MTKAENITDLTGRVAVVIGGASGLGRAIAVGLARSGAHVVASGRREQLVEEVRAEIEACGRETLRQTVDVSERASIDALCDAAAGHSARNAISGSVFAARRAGSQQAASATAISNKATPM